MKEKQTTELHTKHGVNTWRVSKNCVIQGRIAAASDSAAFAVKES